MQAQVARTHVRTHEFGRKEPKMDEKWKEFIKTMNALLALLVGFGALGYGIYRTLQLLGVM